MKKLIEIGDFIGGIFERNSKPSTKGYYVGLCQKYASIGERVLKYIIAVYLAFFISFVALILLESALTGTLVPPLRIYFPGVDAGFSVGFAFVILYNYVVLIVGLLVIGGYNSLLFFIFANIPMVSSVIIGHLDDLKDVLLVPNYKLCNVKRRLFNIILMHNKYIE